LPIRETSAVRRGVRIAAPLVPAAAALGASFGVLARTAHFDAAATIVMSATTFAGSAQVAAVSVLGAGGGAAAAVVAALLLNARYAPIGITVGHAFRGSVLRRLLEAQLVVDESWALSGGGTPRFDRRTLLGVGAALWVAWVGGTVVGALAGHAIGDPSAFGLDGAFAALFAALLAAQLRARRPIAAALAGGAIATMLIPVTAPGVPIIAATGAVVLGWRRP
jgi:4-azaleucine resistance transporter AzlC